MNEHPPQISDKDSVERLRSASQHIMTQALHDVSNTSRPATDSTKNNRKDDAERKSDLLRGQVHASSTVQQFNEHNEREVYRCTEAPGDDQAAVADDDSAVSMVTVAVQTDDVTASELQEMVMRQQLEIYGDALYLYEFDDENE